MGKTSSNSRFNLPGRYAWAVAESVGPLNLLFILLTLPSKLRPAPNHSTSLLTGLPIEHEVLGLLYILHYLNRACITPLFRAPSMSPIHPIVSCLMVLFQYLNSSAIACWLVYSTPNQTTSSPPSLLNPLSVIGTALFALGLTNNIRAESQLFALRRGAAKRKAKSEGRAQVTYDKVYAIPPAEGLFRDILFPHYTWEWVEWTGFWVLGGAWGLGWAWKSPALWFLTNEVCTMLPRAVSGVAWYEGKFGMRAVAGRKGVIPKVL